MNNYKLKSFIFMSAVFLFSALLFYNPSILSDSVKEGLSLCSATIIPSLFPFMVLSEFLVLSGVGSVAGKGLTLLTKAIFNLPGCTSGVILMSLIGGFPIGAGMTAGLVEEKYITKRQGRRMLMFCMNCGPAFSVSAVGVSMLGSKKTGIIIFLSLVISSLFMGFLTRFFSKNEERFSIKSQSDINGGAIVTSVKNSVSSILSICAWVILFSCIGNCIELLPLSEKVSAVVFSFFEVTNGCSKISGILPPYALAGVISWSGFAVHCQVYEYLKKCDMTYGRFLLGRLCNSAFSTAICFGMLKLFRIEAEVISINSDVIVQPYSVSFSSAVAVVVLALFLIADNDLARNERI